MRLLQLEVGPADLTAGPPDASATADPRRDNRRLLEGGTDRDASTASTAVAERLATSAGTAPQDMGGDVMAAAEAVQRFALPDDVTVRWNVAAATTTLQPPPGATESFPQLAASPVLPGAPAETLASDPAGAPDQLGGSLPAPHQPHWLLFSPTGRTRNQTILLTDTHSRRQLELRVRGFSGAVQVGSVQTLPATQAAGPAEAGPAEAEPGGPLSDGSSVEPSA